VRATNALSHVRCYNWLGDGIPKGKEWFSGARVAQRAVNGQITYQWEGLERALDPLVASGVKPVIVCGGIPDVLAEGPIRRNEGGQAVNRPKDYAQYQDLITQMVRRLVKTYGAEEVRTWYFEVWSQPDHEGSWQGGKAAPFTGEPDPAGLAAFLKLYDHFAAGAVAGEAKVRVGGPGIAGDFGFLKRFLEHCARGTNAVTGQPGARLDFISWQRYGASTEVARATTEIRGLIERDFPAFKSAPLLVTENGAGPAEEARVNTAYEAARLAALADANSRDGKGADLIFRAGDLTDDHFDGYRPLITRIGENTVPLPAFRLFTLLTRLGAERLKVEAPAGIGVLATRPSAKVGRNATQVLLYRYDPAASAGGAPVSLQVKITGLPNTLLRLPMRLYRIDPEHGSPYDAWAAAGKPNPAPRDLGQKLLGSAPLAPAEESVGVFINSGAAVMDLKLPPNSVALITLGAETASQAALCSRGERLQRAEAEYAQALQTTDGRKAVENLRKLAERYRDTSWRETAIQSIASLYQVDLRDPDAAEATRKELVELPIDDRARLKLLQRLRVDATRRGDTGGAAAISRRLAQIEQDLAEQRGTTLQRYRGE
jgi:xylan 1,4-beta-xylosidase